MTSNAPNIQGMTIQDKDGTVYIDTFESMQRLNLKSRDTFLKLVKRHNLKRYGVQTSRRVFYREEDISYLMGEETSDVYELPPLRRLAAAAS